MASAEPQEIKTPLRESIALALRLAWSAGPVTFFLVAALSVAGSALAPLQAWLGRQLINLIAAAAAHRPAPGLTATVVALGAVVAGQRVFQQISMYRSNIFTRRVLHHAQRRFLRKAADLDYGYFDDPAWHDKLTRAREQVNYRPYNLTMVLVQLSGYVVTVIGMLGLLAVLHPILLVISLASVLLSAVVQRRVSKKLFERSFTITPEEREQSYLSYLISDHTAAKETRAFGMGDYLLKRHEDVSWRIVNKFADVYKRAERSNLVAGSIGGLLLATAYWFVADRGVSRALTPGDLFLVMSAFASVTAYVAQISSSVVMIQEHATFLRTYFDFIELPSLLPVKDSPTRLPKSLDAGIAFEDVSFTYPKATEPALEHVNLRIRPGEMLALVGDNGAGKTTMVKLLLRLHDPDAGAIRLGGVDLRDADPGDLRGRMGVLFQDFEKYMLSVRENVQLGRVERDATDEEILEALHSARADEILKGLPNGLDSKVGRIFEGGHDLSGGEWQRLALARLMFREADVWVLDEPTSSLDAEAEAAIFAELRANLRGRMGIVISHRFSTVRIADRIAVIAGGRVTELGTHQELVDLGGRYAELFELQAAGYR